MEPQQAAMTVEVNQHILNFKPSASTPTRNEPYKLTFYVENDTYTKQQPQHHIDSRNHVKQQSYNNYHDEVVMESYESPEMYSNKVAQAQRSKHESYCILSAFLNGCICTWRYCTGDEKRKLNLNKISNVTQNMEDKYLPLNHYA
ncbi:hypothetical protein QE152_g7098 [Popillia japonica]|uniref:Uncharacterized protein n=1 Tax=Popillia japonica TaxID=7064 RepID=A0AAW1MFX0_POPJA